MNRNNIVLIGMPASGKSTVGVILAKLMGYDFTDTDLLLQKKHGCKLKDLIQKYGSSSFLDMEAEVCKDLDLTHTVIATGGSVVYRDYAMQHMKDLGSIVYLEVQLPELKKRLHNMKARGVVLENGQKLEDLYNERCVLYQNYADLVIPEGTDPLEKTVACVYKSLNPSHGYPS